VGKKRRRPDKVIRMAKDHQWKCTPGYMLMVADGGAVRFEVPSGWYHDFWSPEGEPASIRVCDVDPPDDNCRLVLSLQRFPIADIDSLPFGKLHPRLDRPEAHHLRRVGFKLAWTTLDVIADRTNGRPIRTFILYGLAPGIQALLSMSCWEEDYEARLPLWLHVVDTFEMAHHVKDLARGTGVRPHLN